MELNIKLILAIVLSVISFYVIYQVKKKTNKFSYATITALTLGVILGAIFKDDIKFLNTFGKGYMSLIRMIVIPLVTTSLITSVVRFENLKSLKSIAIKSLVLLLGTTGIATAIGLIVGKIMNVGQGIVFQGVENFKPKEVPDFSKVFLDFLPSNPVAAIVDNKIIPVIIFSLFIAVALSIQNAKNPEKVKPFNDFILATYEIVMEITRMVLKLIPFGVFALIANAVASNGIDTLKSLIVVIIAVYVAALIQILIVHTSLVTFVAKRNPIEFFKGIFEAQLVAFTSQSSYGTLPVTIKCLVEKLNVSEGVANFVAPLGSTVGMNACGGIYPAIVAIFVANVFNVELTAYSYALIIITAIISSIGIAGVPGSATMSTTVVLSTLGLPIEGMAMVMAVDAIIDMIRTATNVTGAGVAAVVVNELESKKVKKKSTILQTS